MCQLCVTEKLNCDWSVAGRLMRQTSLTRTHHATVVGPIRFSNRSNNCRVCKINGRQLSLVRTHHATIVFSSSLRPTDNKNRMVCAGLKSSPVVQLDHVCSGSNLHHLPVGCTTKLRIGPLQHVNMTCHLVPLPHADAMQSSILRIMAAPNNIHTCISFSSL